MRRQIAAQKPLVSIAVITYNGARYIREQLASLLAQSYSEIEIVVSDDASTDGTAEIVEEFLSDSRLRLIRHSTNQGLSRNLSSVLAVLSGDYIAISDQDDIWHPEKVQLLLDNIGACSAIYADSELIDSEGRSLGTTLLKSLKISEPEIGGNYVGLAYKNSVSGHAALFSADVIKQVIPFNARPIYDQQLAMLAAAINGIAYYPSTLVSHRQHESNSHNQGLVESGRKSRPVRRDRSRQLGENLVFAGMLAREKAGCFSRSYADFVVGTGRALSADRNAFETVLLWFRLLVLSRALFRQSRKKNRLSLISKLIRR